MMVLEVGGHLWPTRLGCSLTAGYGAILKESVELFPILSCSLVGQSPLFIPAQPLPGQAAYHLHPRSQKQLKEKALGWGTYLHHVWLGWELQHGAQLWVLWGCCWVEVTVPLPLCSPGAS